MNRDIFQILIWTTLEFSRTFGAVLNSDTTCGLRALLHEDFLAVEMSPFEATLARALRGAQLDPHFFRIGGAP